MEEKFIISETNFGDNDTNITTLAGEWHLGNVDIYNHRLNWVAKRSVNTNARYNVISQSQFPPDFDNYMWDYSNYDGIGSGSSYIQSWSEYVNENDIKL